MRGKVGGTAGGLREDFVGTGGAAEGFEEDGDGSMGKGVTAGALIGV